MKTLSYACLQTSRASYDARPALLGKLQPGDVCELKVEYGYGGSRIIMHKTGHTSSFATQHCNAGMQHAACEDIRHHKSKQVDNGCNDCSSQMLDARANHVRDTGKHMAGSRQTQPREGLTCSITCIFFEGFRFSSSGLPKG